MEQLTLNLFKNETYPQRQMEELLNSIDYNFNLDNLNYIKAYFYRIFSTRKDLKEYERRVFIKMIKDIRQDNFFICQYGCICKRKKKNNVTI